MAFSPSGCGSRERSVPDRSPVPSIADCRGRKGGGGLDKGLRMLCNSDEREREGEREGERERGREREREREREERR